MQSKHLPDSYAFSGFAVSITQPSESSVQVYLIDIVIVSSTLNPKFLNPKTVGGINVLSVSLRQHSNS